MRRRRIVSGIRVLLAASLLLVPGCGRDEAPGPRWTDLTEGFRPREPAAVAADFADSLASGAEIHRDGDGAVWIRIPIEGEAWERARRPDAWFVPLPDHPELVRARGESRLVAEDRELRRGHEHEGSHPDMYLVHEKRLFLQAAPGQDPPSRCWYDKRLDAGSEEDGRWRVRTPRVTGFGLPVYSGSWEMLRTQVPPKSRLRFATGGVPVEGESFTYRVRLGDRVLWERSAAEGEHVSVELPPEGVADAQLRFEVDGGRGLGVFFTPVIGPGEVGSFRKRPWGEDRRDLVLFLADTFRADNLAAWGGDPELAPNLNRLVEESRHYLGARSTSAWTLPAISSVLTGLFPGQHGATRQERSLSRELQTIGDTFRTYGYRSVAITDSAFFSPTFGLDQGFDLFLENPLEFWSLDRTIRQALDWLDADDGRPALLLVHTYRTHSPYRSGPEEDQSGYKAFIREEMARLRADPERALELAEQRLVEHGELLYDFYVEGVRDLDHKFARFQAELETRGLFETGALLFTSDHGESCGEHGEVSHGGRLWDVKLAVPMFLHGASIEPGAVTAHASLVDVAPTLSSLAGIPVEEHWVGSSLLDLPLHRPVFAFRLEGEENDEIAIVRDGRKILTGSDVEALRRGDVRAAFDVAEDPEEENDLRGRSKWPAELARESADALEVLLTPALGIEEADVSEQMRARLAEIGYGGE